MPKNYTPGPWPLDVESESVSGCREIGDVASTNGLADDDEDRGNAVILSAAVEMYEAASSLLAAAITGEAPRGYALVPLDAMQALRSATPS